MKKWVLFLMVLIGVNGAEALLWFPDYLLDTACPKEKPFGYLGEFSDLFDSNSCVGCDSLKRIKIAKGHEKDFEICSNRKVIEQYDTKYSILKECPSEAPIRDNAEGCISCADTGLVFANKVECDKCLNRRSVKDPEYPYAGSDVCELKECPPEAPLRNNHECLPCDREGLVLSDGKETCEKCPNTYKWYQDKCVPIKKTHYDGSPLLNDLSWTFRVEDSDLLVYGSVGCKIKDPITTTQENCSQCSNREYVDGKCILKKE